ncbi:MAG: LysM peptidoglycan-binding domain-containing protein [Anaerolineaceae bacterium]|nr:LysM peptidoglycan-binding domain-containing protein [Anaerolineaceae bacterium]
MRRLMFLAIVLALLVPVAAVTAQTTHTVQRGQTLYSISLRYGVTVADILTANPWLGSGNVLHAGNQLVIPVPGQPAPQPSAGQPQPATQEVRHTVAPGEFLSQIGQRYGVSYVDIINRNNIANPDVLHVGTVLIIPGVTVAPTEAPTGAPAGQPQPSAEVRHTVARGEYLGIIAERYGVLVADILRRNNIANPDLVYPGTVLIIPGVVAAAPAETGEAPPPPPPVSVPAIGGGFALGGQALSFAWPHHMHAARMTWVKRQVRYHAGDNAANVRGVIDQAHGAGFRVLLSVVGEPGQMAGNPSGYIQEFVSFLGGVASLGPDAIEVWNEQNIDREWPNGQISPQAYTNMLSQAWNAIKGANANVMVISGAPAPTGFFGGGCHASGCDDLPFIRGMAAAGAASYMDCVGVHYNEGILPPDARSGDPRGNSGHYTRYYSRMFEVYAAAFPGKPLCFTELGYLSSEGYGPLPGGFAWAANVSVANQAAWLGRAVTLARSSGRVRLFIVWNVDATRYDSDPQAGFAIVRPDGTCPACGHLAAAMG